MPEALFQYSGFLGFLWTLVVLPLLYCSLLHIQLVLQHQTSSISYLLLFLMFAPQDQHLQNDVVQCVAQVVSSSLTLPSISSVTSMLLHNAKPHLLSTGPQLAFMSQKTSTMQEIFKHFQVQMTAVGLPGSQLPFSVFSWRKYFSEDA